MKWFGKLLLCFAIELEKFEQRVTDLLRERVPGLSDELLPEWEKDLALPEPTSTKGQTKNERAQIAHAKYTANYSGQSKQFYVDYAAALGAVITVKEYQGTGAVFRVDVNRVDRMPGAGTPDERRDGSRLWSYFAPFKWVITFISITGNVSQTNIEAELRSKSPAHTILYFN